MTKSLHQKQAGDQASKKVFAKTKKSLRAIDKAGCLAQAWVRLQYALWLFLGFGQFAGLRLMAFQPCT
jgi:hypothetical protein